VGLAETGCQSTATDTAKAKRIVPLECGALAPLSFSVRFALTTRLLQERSEKGPAKAVSSRPHCSENWAQEDTTKPLPAEAEAPCAGGEEMTSTPRRPATINTIFIIPGAGVGNRA
jgi:hypothetical protein